MNTTLQRLLQVEQLIEMAGVATFERGQIYAAEERVISLKITNNVVDAKVQGCQEYEVRLWLKGKKLQYFCSCPFAVEGAFCKHCVAVGLIVTAYH